MCPVSTLTEVEYPESDGRPMGETDLHRNWMIRIYDLLRHRYRGQRVYVASDLLVYYEEGNPSRVVVPDDFVVFDCEPGERRVFKIWEEQRTPGVVFEVTSKSTKQEDMSRKPARYAQIGVRELFLYDPTRDYILESIRGFRLDGGQLVPIEPDESRAIESDELDVWLQLGDDDQLVMIDRATGDRLLTPEEDSDARAEAANAREKAAAERAETAAAREKAAAERAETAAAREKAAAERAETAAAREKSAAAQAEAAEARAEAAEAEVRRLRELLSRQGGNGE